MATSESLRQYKAKRNFSISSEPPDGGETSTAGLSFVVQKHWATRLHYDFRLELDGSMKSWAVPKGPSFDSRDKRMAVHVEDHPISYSSFEGTIPAKQYGAGKVIIWDKGIWLPIGDPRAGYRDGNLKFELRGHKLRGKWVLVRMKGKGEKQEPWLLIKEKDEFVRPALEFSVVDALPDSVKSLPMPGAVSAETGVAAATRARAPAPGAMPVGVTRSALPETLAPQLATLVDGPPTNYQDWLYEIKFDGYRLLARIDGKSIKLLTRNGNDWTAKLKPLQKELARLKLPDGWYDGEIVVHNAQGTPDFGALQSSFDAARTDAIVYYVFDLPYFDGNDLRATPLQARRDLLQKLFAAFKSDKVKFSAEFDAPPENVLASACQLGLEGVIAKRRDSNYQSSRSADWIKLKCGQRQEFVIGGFTDPKGSRSGIGALLLGVHDAKGELQYAGNVGTGFSDARLRELKARLDPLVCKTAPFASTTGLVGRPHWVKPVLVAEVSFGEWTHANHIRHSVFQGLRTDKPATQIVREKAASAARVGRPSAKAAPVSHALADKLRVTNPERVIDGSTGTTKIELVRYYDLVGDLMMAHLKNRPVSLVRAPSGVGGQLFFQKHAETEKLPGIQQLDPALYVGHPPLLEVVDKQGLLSAAQWNVVEFHTLNTPTASLQRPDRMVFDLDPGEGVAWKTMQQATELVHAFLTQLGLPSFLKTSGGKGLHLVVPLRKLHDWEVVRGFSQAVVAHLATTIPQIFVAKSGPKNRVGKIFVDYLRNGIGATTASAWSARARPGLGISVPVGWEELAGLHSGAHWTIRTAHTRLDRGNAPWSGYAGAAKGLSSAMKLLSYKAPAVTSRRSVKPARVTEVPAFRD
jgi:bifunctional non-homologous end joining protein LigD